MRALPCSDGTPTDDTAAAMMRAAAVLSCDDARAIRNAVAVLERRRSTRAARAAARATLMRLVVSPELADVVTPSAMPPQRQRVDDASE